MIVPLHHVLILSSALFAAGVFGLLARRNLLFMLISIEVMLNAAGLAFVATGARYAQGDGQVLYIFMLTVAAAEVAIGLALVLEIRRRRATTDADALRSLRG